ncbi:MAG: hypothetical protein LVQ95_01155 [Candidatus Micrarchaeales archaeon]|nr:hypothetical protein [Candidatus Micrarchaeales archaeon]
MNAFQEVSSEIVGGVVLTIFIVVFLMIFAALGNTVSSLPGGAQSASAVNYGSIALITIGAIAGIAGTIKLAQILLNTFDGVRGLGF